MTIKLGDLEASIQERIDSDTDFQSGLADLSDEDKVQSLADKRQELFDGELASLEEKANKSEENYKSQKVRAEKAEAGLKAKPEVKADAEVVKNTSVKDILALRDVHEDDLDYLLDEAKLRKKTIAEIRKDHYTQIILKARAEERVTAQATATGSGRRVGEIKSSEQSLLKRAQSSELSPSEMTEAARLTIAAMAK